LCEAGVQTDSYESEADGMQTELLAVRAEALEAASKQAAADKAASVGALDAEVLDVTDKGVQVKHGHDSSEDEGFKDDVKDDEVMCVGRAQPQQAAGSELQLQPQFMFAGSI
jgi:hypothetical protein